MSCPSDNAAAIDQTDFWDPVHGINWDQHRIGWAISGGCALLTVIITIFSVWQHCRNYTVPREQRQIIRILYMPPVYAVISFFSYRFFRSYTYYSLVYVAYEAVTISAFLLLIIEYVADTGANHNAESAIARKDKRPLPIPLCCWRYRPTKPYFMYTVKWAVLQYVIVRPALSVAAIVCEAFGVLCDSESFNPRFASVYLSAADFISISVALYGLLLFYGLTKEELSDRRPLAKFLCIKLIVMFTFYQTFVFSMLEGRVIKATQYWTETNIADGLNAMTICIEMVFFALAMAWAYPAKEYKTPNKPRAPTSIWRPLWDSINYIDFAREIFGSLRYFVDRGFHRDHTKPDFGTAFGLDGARAGSAKLYPGAASGSQLDLPDEDGIRMGPYDPVPPGQGFGANERLAQPQPYSFAAPAHSHGSDTPQTAAFSPRRQELAYDPLP